MSNGGGVEKEEEGGSGMEGVNGRKEMRWKEKEGGSGGEERDKNFKMVYKVVNTKGQKKKKGKKKCKVRKGKKKEGL